MIRTITTRHRLLLVLCGVLVAAVTASAMPGAVSALSGPGSILPATPVPVPPLLIVEDDADSDGPPDSTDQLSEDERADPLAVAAQQAVDRGLAYLATTQIREPGFNEGAWKNDVGYKLNYDYTVTKRDGYHPGVTAICCLAYMANGHMPGRGRYGEVVRRGLNFVLRCLQSDEHAYGYLTYDGTRMYSHAFATLFLAEVLGMCNLSAEQEERVRSALRAAVNLIVRTQNELGSWRYQPFASDADMSIAVCQTQALRAARNVGVIVPPSTISRAREYISQAYQQYGGWSGRAGTFLYQYDEPPSRTSWTLTAAGIVAMQSAGNYTTFVRDGQTLGLTDAVEFLKNNMPVSLASVRNDPNQRMEFGYFYGHYYAAQAIYQYDRDHPGEWRQWIRNVRQKFIALQRTNGYWEDEIGINYATAMVCLVLQIHHEYLPIFQK